nr:interleukin-10-like protein [Baboon cytomegalovirus]
MGSRPARMCGVSNLLCLLLVVLVAVVIDRGCGASKPSKPPVDCDPIHGTLSRIIKEVRTGYGSIKHALQSKDTVYYVSLFHENLLNEMLSPVGCRVTNELMQHYLDGVLPRAFQCGYDNTTLDGLHSLVSSLDALYKHMLKCPALACTGQTPAWTQFLETEHKLDPWKGTIKATAEMDLLVNYLETFLAQS